MIPIAFGNIAGPSLQALMTAKVAPDQQGRLQGAHGLDRRSDRICRTDRLHPDVRLVDWAGAAAVGLVGGSTILVGAAITLPGWPGRLVVH